MNQVTSANQSLPIKVRIMCFIHECAEAKAFDQPLPKDPALERIIELEQAIRHADEWVGAHEGVSLTYYMQDSREESVVASIRVIEELLKP